MAARACSLTSVNAFFAITSASVTLSAILTDSSCLASTTCFTVLCGWTRGSALTSTGVDGATGSARSEEHTSELQSLMRISYAVFCLKKKTQNTHHILITTNSTHVNI